MIVRAKIHRYRETGPWSEEREENLIRLLEEQPVLYDVGMLLRHCGGTWCGVLKRLRVGLPY